MGMEMILIIFATFFGTSGLFMYVARKYIDKAFKDAEEKTTLAAKEMQEYYRLLMEMSSARNSFAFWLHKGIKKLDPKHEFWNGELSDAVAKINKIDSLIKEQERNIVARHRQD